MARDSDVPDAQQRVQWVYRAEGRDDLEARYDRWAKDYDKDLTGDFGYIAPRLAVAQWAPDPQADPLVLDAGVGTGLVGEALQAAGVRRIVGIDLSEGMLDVARRKGLYQALHRMILGEPLDFPDDRFDATLCIGTLTQGHAPASSLAELVRVTKPGGAIVFSLLSRIYETQGFKEMQQSLQDQGRWHLVERQQALHIMPKGEPDLEHDIWHYRVA